MEGTPEIDPRLLEILVCPLTKAPLRYDREAQELISEEAGLAYPIRDGIPIMLVEEARSLRDDETATKRLPSPWGCGYRRRNGARAVGAAFKPAEKALGVHVRRGQRFFAA